MISIRPRRFKLSIRPARAAPLSNRYRDGDGKDRERDSVSGGEIICSDVGRQSLRGGSSSFRPGRGSPSADQGEKRRGPKRKDLQERSAVYRRRENAGQVGSATRDYESCLTMGRPTVCVALP